MQGNGVLDGFREKGDFVKEVFFSFYEGGGPVLVECRFEFRRKGVEVSVTEVAGGRAAGSRRGEVEYCCDGEVVCECWTKFGAGSAGDE